mgnify:FL=1
MPAPENPICSEGVYEIERQAILNKEDEICLVGHSLGWSAILRFLEQTSSTNLLGVILVSSPSEKNKNKKLDSFLEEGFNFEKIKQSSPWFVLIHWDNDTLVPLQNAEFLSEKLASELIVIKNGAHLNGSAGWLQLPECLMALKKMIEND